MSMAIADTAHCADGCCKFAKIRQRLAGLASFVPRHLTISVVLCALAAAGCARNPAPREFKPVQHEVKANRARAISPKRYPERYPEPRRQAELRISRPDPALLVPQSAPDCEFKRADVNAVDSNEWARLKIEYERECYQNAERAARDRLSQLQASGTCEIESVPQRQPAR
jgi:hypothetical protein